jgi:hypothetical protein
MTTYRFNQSVLLFLLDLVTSSPSPAPKPSPKIQARYAQIPIPPIHRTPPSVFGILTKAPVIIIIKIITRRRTATGVLRRRTQSRAVAFPIRAPLRRTPLMVIPSLIPPGERTCPTATIMVPPLLRTFTSLTSDVLHLQDTLIELSTIRGLLCTSCLFNCTKLYKDVIPLLINMNKFAKGLKESRRAAAS